MKKGLVAVVCLSLLIPTYLHAKKKEEQRNPLGCVDVGYEYELKTLSLLPKEAGERNSLYFIRNKSNQRIHLCQMRNNESSRSMHLNHTIHPSRWAVLSTCEKEIKYFCAVPDRKSKYGRIVDCEKNLQVCEFARVRFGLNNRGNHWIVENNTRNGALRAVVRYGIIPQ